MEITNEIKAKVFAQYLGQQYKTDVPIMGHHNYEGELTPQILYRAMDRIGWKWEFKIKLKPLSKITDEDAIEVGKLVTVFEKPCDRSQENLITLGKIYTKDGFYIGYKNHWNVYQFLQSKGYDLPQYLLGGKTLYKCNLAIYE